MPGESVRAPGPDLPGPATPPDSTYRLQFHAGFTFQAARRLVPYLSALGVSHIYASPYVTARSGSSHGYDVANPNALNPEIGDEDDYREFVA
ncbi:MAG: alpha-amylase family glycosyl hydrolase, partial [Chloroflexota bacterium]